MLPYSSLTMIVPCKNESENIKHLRHLINEIPIDIEIILIEGGSTDDTVSECQAFAAQYPQQVMFMRQTTKGKMNAVYEAAKHTSKKSVAIFDADLTVGLSTQLEMIDSYLKLEGSSILIGNRLNKKMHKGSMRFANFIGNQFFALLLSLIFKTRIKDSLCGTKIFPTVLLTNPSCRYMQRNDPFGDFTILAEALCAGLDVRNHSVEYMARRYGQTNIRRWSSGVKLAKLTWHLGREHNSGFQKHE